MFEKAEREFQKQFNILVFLFPCVIIKEVIKMKFAKKMEKMFVVDNMDVFAALAISNLMNRF